MQSINTIFSVDCDDFCRAVIDNNLVEDYQANKIDNYFMPIGLPNVQYFYFTLEASRAPEYQKFIKDLKSQGKEVEFI